MINKDIFFNSSSYWGTFERPNRQNQNAQSNTDLPIVETKNTNELPNWQNETCQSNMTSPTSPIVATNIDK